MSLFPDPEEREARSHAFRFGSDDKKKMEELGELSDSSLDANAKQSMYSNESGLCSLMPKNEKPKATLLDPGLIGSWAMPIRSKKFG